VNAQSLTYLKASIFYCLKTLLSTSYIGQTIAELNFILNSFMGCIIGVIVISNAPLIYSKALTRLQNTIDLLIAANLYNKKYQLSLTLQKESKLTSPVQTVQMF
jgi:hypothetical protein